MENLFFEQPILNSPYDAPTRHWELDKDGQPTQRTLSRVAALSSLRRPFEKPETGRIAVKVINHLGDEAMRILCAE